MSRFNLALLGIDGDRVAVLDEGERAAHVGFGRDVADDKAVAAAGEAAVGDERDIFAETFAHDGGGGREHFAHAGTAFGPFVTNDDHVAFDDRAVENCRERLLLRN